MGVSGCVREKKSERERERVREIERVCMCATTLPDSPKRRE